MYAAVGPRPCSGTYHSLKTVLEYNAESTQSINPSHYSVKIIKVAAIRLILRFYHVDCKQLLDTCSGWVSIFKQKSTT